MLLLVLLILASTADGVIPYKKDDRQNNDEKLAKKNNQWGQAITFENATGCCYCGYCGCCYTCSPPMLMLRSKHVNPPKKTKTSTRHLPLCDKVSRSTKRNTIN